MCLLTWDNKGCFTFLFLNFNVYECFSECMTCTTCVPGTHGGQNRGLDPLELEL